MALLNVHDVLSATINNKVDYFPNVFEYLGLDQELDSVYQFLNSYSIYEFDETKSVPGDIINGRTEYLDSVTSLTNELFRALGRINSEDSTYWMVAPTNDEWTKLSTAYTDYFNYFWENIFFEIFSTFLRIFKPVHPRF